MRRKISSKEIIPFTTLSMEVLPSEEGTLSLYFVQDREAGVFHDHRKKKPKGYQNFNSTT